MTRLIVDGNMLTGPIPSEIGMIEALELFNVQSNMLSSTIPTEVGNLLSLTEFTLSMNNIVGVVPPEVCLLRNASLTALVPDCTVNCTCCTSCV